MDGTATIPKDLHMHRREKDRAVSFARRATCYIDVAIS